MTTPSRDELLEKVIKAITEVKDVDPGAVTIDSSFEDLRVDSLDAIEVLFELEDDLGTSLPDAAVRQMRTVKDVIDGLEKFLSGEIELSSEEKALADELGQASGATAGDADASAAAAGTGDDGETGAEAKSG